MLFTGLIQHLGTIFDIKLNNGECTLTISDSAPILVDCTIGCLISVNGVCLTVVRYDKVEHDGWFIVQLANEMLRRTDLGDLKLGDQVNLERALSTQARFGGHFVQGNVDTTATIVDKTADGDSLRVLFQLPDESCQGQGSLLPLLIPKGYVALDGTSLTLTSVDDDNRIFGVMLITLTQEKITLSKKPVGSRVNVEVDIMGKLLKSSLDEIFARAEGSGEDIVLEKVFEESERMVQQKEAEMMKRAMARVVG